MATRRSLELPSCLVEQFDAKPAEIRALFNNTLDARRATQLRDKMLRAGLPL